jgi:hypothetical protein
MAKQTFKSEAIIETDKAVDNLKKLDNATSNTTNKLKGLDSGLSKVSSTGKNTSNSTNMVSKGLGGLNVAAGLAGGAILGLVTSLTAFIKSSFDSNTELTKLSTGMDDFIKKNNIMANGVVTNNEAMVKSIQDASKGTISEYDAQLLANKALQLGVVKSQDEMVALTQKMAVIGQKAGRNATDAMNDFIEGVGKGSTELLDNLNIITRADEAYSSYAEKLGITASKLTDVQKKEAFRLSALQSATKAYEDLGGEASLVVSEQDKLTAAVSDLKTSLGALVDGPATELLQVANLIVSAFTEGAQAWEGLLANEGFNRFLEGVTTLGVSELTRVEGGENLSSEELETLKEINRIKEQIRFYGEGTEEAKELNRQLDEINKKEKERLDTQADLNLLATRGNNFSLDKQKEFQKAVESEKKAKLEILTLEKQKATLQALASKGLVKQTDLITFMFDETLGGQEREKLFNDLIHSAKMDNIANQANAITRLGELQAQLAQAEINLEAKKQQAVASFNKRRDSFYAKEEKRIEGLRESGLKGIIGGMVSDMQGELGEIFETTPLVKLPERVRRLAAVAAGDIGGESAQLLKQFDFDIYDQIFSSGGSPEEIAARAQAMLEPITRGLDPTGLFKPADIATVADHVVNMVLGSEGESIQDAIYNEIVSRNVLTPEQLDKAFNITRQEFGETLDLQMVADSDIKTINKLKEDIKELGDSGKVDIEKLINGIEGLDTPLDNVSEDLQDWISYLNEIIEQQQKISGGFANMGVGSGDNADSAGGDGGGGGVTPQTPPNTSTTPNTSNTSFSGVNFRNVAPSFSIPTQAPTFNLPFKGDEVTKQSDEPKQVLIAINEDGLSDKLLEIIQSNL